MSLVGTNFKLNNGKLIPAVAYGAGTKWYKSTDNGLDQSLVDTFVTAFDSGITHIDGAEVYNTNLEIGEAVRTSGKKREDLFVTSKYFPGNPKNPYEALKADLQSKLKLDYVDLYLLHSPFIKKESNGFSLEEAWGFLEQLVAEGYAKSIGVSNFAAEDLDRVLKVAKIQPAAHQIEFNPQLQEQTPGIVAHSQKHGILVEAYSPLGPLVKRSENTADLEAYLAEVAQKHPGKDASQVLLRWVLQHGVLPITTSAKKERVVGSLNIFDFELSKDEVAKIDELGSKHTLRQWWTSNYGHFDKK